MSFPFEKLIVYQKSIEWTTQVESLSRELRGKVSHSLIDQLFRASLSISLNIAEGNGRWHKPDKRQFFWIARGSVFECVPILHTLRAVKAIDEERFTVAYRAIEEIAKMVSGLIQSVERLKP
jgi:four helix bundle protein